MKTDTKDQVFRCFKANAVSDNERLTVKVFSTDRLSARHAIVDYLYRRSEALKSERGFIITRLWECREDSKSPEFNNYVLYLHGVTF